MNASVDGEAELFATQLYDSFGRPTTYKRQLIGQNLSVEQEFAVAHADFLYVGQEFDRETGLQYSRARYYDPVTHEFISQDPLGFAAGDTNLYRRVGNSPHNATDPSGEFWHILGGAAVGGIIGAGAYLFFAEEYTLGGFLAATGGGAVAGALATATFGASLAFASSTTGLGLGLSEGAAFTFATTASGTAAGFGGGFTQGAVQRGIDDPNAGLSDILESGWSQGKRGAFYGGVGGLTVGIVGPAFAAVAGESILGTGAAWGLAGATSDVVTQLAGIGYGYQDSYDIRQTAFAGITAGLLSAGYKKFQSSRASRSARPELPDFDGRTTHGVLVSRDGRVLQRFSSGNKNPAYKNYASAGHAEGKAAIWMRENGVTDAVLYHNNPSGTCNWCHPQISTLLPEGAAMQVVPPAGTVKPSPRWHVRPDPYVGTSRVPKTN